FVSCETPISGGALDLSQFDHIGLCAAVKNDENRQNHTACNAFHHTHRERDDKSDKQHHKITSVGIPQIKRMIKLEQTEDRYYNDRTEHGQRQIIKKGCEKKQTDPDKYRRNDRSDSGPAARVTGDPGTRKTAVRGQ